MTPADIEFLTQLCRSRAGVKAPGDKPYLLQSRLGPTARREDFASVEALIAAVREKREERLIWAVVEAMTANETAFFRDRDSLEAVGRSLLPVLAQRRGDAPLRLWSAACATGQEVYSLAMLVDEARAALPGLKVELFGSDISERCLEKAQSGLYTQFEVQRGLSVRRLVRYFGKSGDMWALDARLRQMVRWRRINLIADLSQLGRFDIVLMRHVLAGMDPSLHGRMLENISHTLADDGFLVLGQNESLAGLTRALSPVEGLPGVYGRNPGHRAAA